MRLARTVGQKYDLKYDLADRSDNLDICPIYALYHTRMYSIFYIIYLKKDTLYKKVVTVVTYSLKSRISIDFGRGDNRGDNPQKVVNVVTLRRDMTR